MWEEGVKSSYFLPEKMSMATKWHLAWPCLPVLELETSATLQGRLLMTRKPFLLWRGEGKEGRGGRVRGRRGWVVERRCFFLSLSLDRPAGCSCPVSHRIGPACWG